MRRGLALLGAAGGVASVASLWLPWFVRTFVVTFATPRLEGSLSGWDATGWLSIGVLAAAAVAVLGAIRPVPPFALFAAGAVALVASMGAVVAEIGTPALEVTHSSPGAGLLLGVAGASCMALAGLAALVGDARRRLEAARAQ